MNKKLLYGLMIPLFAIVLVSAVVIYLDSVDVTFNVDEPLSTTEELMDFSGYAGDCINKSVFIDNLANNPIPVQLFWLETENLNSVTYETDMPKIDEIVSGGNNVTIELCYTPDSVLGDVSGEVTIVRGTGDNAIASFTKKDLITWEHIGEPTSIIYSVSGGTFNVVGIPEEYTLIYYPNTDGDVFTTNIANVIVLSEGSNDIDSLPLGIDIGDNYCANGLNPVGVQCSGAKLWLIPGNEEEAMASVSSWSNPETYLFETDLITYTKTA